MDEEGLSPVVMRVVMVKVVMRKRGSNVVFANQYHHITSRILRALGVTKRILLSLSVVPGKERLFH